MGGETAGSEAMLGVVEDKSRIEPEQAGARVLVDSLDDALLGTEADSLRSMLVLATPYSTAKRWNMDRIQGMCRASSSGGSFEQPRLPF